MGLGQSSHAATSRWTRIRRCALLGALWLVAARPLAAQQTATPAYEEGLFDLIVAGLPTATVSVLVTPRGTYLVPMRATLEHLGVPILLVRDSGLAHVTRAGGTGTNTIHWTAPRQIVAASTIPLDSLEVVERAGEVYVSASRLGTLVDGTVEVDLATLTLHASRPAGFPAQIRRDLLAHRSAQLARAAPTSSSTVIPFDPLTGFGVVEWSLSGSGRGVLATPTTAETRVGVGVYGGMLKSRTALRLGTPPEGSSTIAAQELSYQRVFPANERVRQLQLGDIVSDGAVARAMRGVTVTNAPFVRGISFDEVPFSRPLPPGWEYEVYEGSRLLGYADAGTTTPLRIPLQYGATPLRVRLYGPAGEVIESAVSYVIPVEQLPVGAWQYAAGAGRCALQECDGLAYGELRHGISRWLTLQGGIDGVRDSVGQTIRAYGAVSLVPSPGWTAAVQARSHAYLRAAVSNLGEGRVTGGMTAGVNAPEQGGTAVQRDAERVWFAQSNLLLRSILPGLRNRALSLSSRVEGAAQAGLRRWDMTATTPTPWALLEVGVQSDPRGVTNDTTTTSGPVFRVAPTLSLTRGVWRKMGSPVLRVEAGMQGGRLAQWDIGASLQPGRAFVSVALRRLIGVDNPQLAIGGTVPLGMARVLTHFVTRRGAVEGGYTASGAVAVGALTRATSLAYGGLGLAGVEGRVYRDRDGNGEFGDGDEPAGNVVVQVGGLRTHTDAQGRYALWNMTPYEPLEVMLDSLSLEDPSWNATRSQRALRLSPHMYTRVDFPLTHTREVVGRIAGPTKDGAPGGVAISLRDSTTGLVYDTRTFSDGAFYLSRVRPGRYRLRVAEPSLRALRATQGVIEDIVIRGDADEVVELPPILLVPDPRAP